MQARAAVSVSDRPATFAFIDEFQDYLHLPTGVEHVLAQARSLGLGLTLAHQHLGQLPASVREAVLANGRSRVIFQVAASDAQATALRRQGRGHLKPWPSVRYRVGRGWDLPPLRGTGRVGPSGLGHALDTNSRSRPVRASHSRT